MVLSAIESDSVSEPVHLAYPGQVASMTTEITPHYLYDVGKIQLHTVTQY